MHLALPGYNGNLGCAASKYNDVRRTWTQKYRDYSSPRAEQVRNIYLRKETSDG
jgi:hypothetical protein